MILIYSFDVSNYDLDIWSQVVMEEDEFVD